MGVLCVVICLICEHISDDGEGMASGERYWPFPLHQKVKGESLGDEEEQVYMGGGVHFYCWVESCVVMEETVYGDPVPVLSLSHV